MSFIMNFIRNVARMKRNEIRECKPTLDSTAFHPGDIDI